jgi:lipoyl(octanoyl) transferase
VTVESLGALPVALSLVPDPLLAVAAVQWWGRTPYQDAWDRQRTLHAEVASGNAPDTLVLVEHDAVYTAGRRTTDEERRDADAVVDVDRGGKITWHGPGQLVGYPIVRLSDPVDVVAHVRQIEALVINACATLGVPSQRIEGRSGVWTIGTESRAPAKLGAVGVRVARGTTMHGFAVNADCDLRAYDAIIPCGIRDATVTSLSTELGRTIDLNAVRSAVLQALGMPEPEAIS